MRLEFGWCKSDPYKQINVFKFDYFHRMNILFLYNYKKNHFDYLNVRRKIQNFNVFSKKNF